MRSGGVEGEDFLPYIADPDSMLTNVLSHLVCVHRSQVDYRIEAEKAEQKAVSSQVRWFGLASAVPRSVGMPVLGNLDLLRTACASIGGWSGRSYS